MKTKHYSRTYKKCRLIVVSIVLIAAVSLMNGCHKIDHHIPSHKDKVDLKLIADGLVSPLGVVEAPDNSNRLFVIDQIGKIWIIDAHGNKLGTPFIDLTDRLVSLTPDFDERGLLGLAFHPNYKDNGRFFIYRKLECPGTI
jgi:hypothetical protein